MYDDTFKGCLIKDKWQGVYYPNGCLICEGDYLWSPIFNSRNSCLSWGESLKAKSKNSDDTFECGKNCKWDGNFNICEETI